MHSRRGVFALCGVVVVASIATLTLREPVSESSSRGSVPATTVPASGSVSTTVTPSTTVAPSTTVSTTTLPPSTVAVDRLLASMTLRQRVLHLLVLGAGGPDPAGTIGAVLGDVCIGGVFVAGNAGNWSPAGSPEAAAASIGMIAAATSDCAAAPFVTTDAEVGTRVLKVPVDPLPDPATLVDNHRSDPATTAEGLAPAASAFAAEMRALGVHVNLGVIADVDVDAGYYMARQRRSFGADPEVVVAITEALVEGHCAAGVAPTLKHFPNQGSTLEDPHRDDSFSTNDPAAWRVFGALPYERTRAPLVMTGHVRYVGVDDQTPATLSAEITGWLRSDLGYEGVIITDDLHTMRGVADQFAPAERAVSAISAGADLALYVAPDDAVAVVEAVVSRAERDATFAASVDESVRRVLRLKGALGLLVDTDPAWFTLCPSN